MGYTSFEKGCYREGAQVLLFEKALHYNDNGKSPMPGYVYLPGVESLKSKEVDGSLDLTGTSIDNLPENLKINGSLHLPKGMNIELPKNLYVYGNLDLRGTQVDSISENLYVRGLLYLNKSIKKLGKKMRVGYIALRDSSLTSLPEDMTVESNLSVSHTGITSMGDGIVVKGEFDFRESILNRLPKNFEVRKSIRFPQEVDIYLDEGLSIGQSLDLSKVKLKKTPKGLRVQGDLFGLDYVEEIGEDTYIGGDLYVGPNLKYLPGDLTVMGKVYPLESGE